MSAPAAAARRARQAVAGTQLRTGGKSLSVTLSGGLADFLPGDDEREIVRRADEAGVLRVEVEENVGQSANYEWRA